MGTGGTSSMDTTMAPSWKASGRVKQFFCGYILWLWIQYITVHKYSAVHSHKYNDVKSCTAGTSTQTQWFTSTQIQCAAPQNTVWSFTQIQCSINTDTVRYLHTNKVRYLHTNTVQYRVNLQKYSALPPQKYSDLASQKYSVYLHTNTVLHLHTNTVMYFQTNTVIKVQYSMYLHIIQIFTFTKTRKLPYRRLFLSPVEGCSLWMHR